MDIEERCRERARTYGDLRCCSQTAITLDAAADELATLRAKLAIASEALIEIELFGRGNPGHGYTCAGKAKEALDKLDSDRKAAMDELIAMSAEEIDNAEG